ncbi:hypothetical protein ACWATR_29690 [Nostoc sp. UIC 10890]|jgi:hypothetical protein
MPSPCGLGAVAYGGNPQTLSTRRYRERLERVRVPLQGSKLRVASRREAMPQALRCAIALQPFGHPTAGVSPSAKGRG